MQGNIETRIGVFVLAAVAVFVYMGFQIGSFRFDRANYNNYIVYFTDISGLSRKGQVKIAGVEVGWVEDITLIDSGPYNVRVLLTVLKEYVLTTDAYASVRQDGLLGSKYIEIYPGDALFPQLESGAELSHPSVQPISIDDLLRQVKKIAVNIEEVTDTFKNALGGDARKDQIETLVNNVSDTAARMSTVSDIIERAVVRNEGNLDAILDIGNQVGRVVDRLDGQVLPSFQDNVEKISNAFDYNFSRVSDDFHLAAKSIQEGFESIDDVAQKINRGEGLIGKLLTEDETYEDLKMAVGGLREYFTKMDRLQLVFDSHIESMNRPAENYGKFEDSKVYFDVRLYPAEDYFFQLQVVGSEKGFVDRFQVNKSYYDLK